MFQYIARDISISQKRLSIMKLYFLKNFCLISAYSLDFLKNFHFAIDKGYIFFITLQRQTGQAGCLSHRGAKDRLNRVGLGGKHKYLYHAIVVCY